MPISSQAKALDSCGDEGQQPPQSPSPIAFLPFLLLQLKQQLLTAAAVPVAATVATAAVAVRGREEDCGGELLGSRRIRKGEVGIELWCFVHSISRKDSILLIAIRDKICELSQGEKLTLKLLFLNL